MIEILKKRYKVGDPITLHTGEDSFTGTIDSFEDSCLILSTNEGLEFIANEIIKRISIPKLSDNERQENNIPESKEKLKEEKWNENKSQEHTPEPKVQVPDKIYKVGDKIPLDVLEKRLDKSKSTKSSSVSPITIANNTHVHFSKLEHEGKSKRYQIKQKGKGITLGSLSDLKHLILPEIEAENKKIVSANGTISRYFGDRNFGFITDKFGTDIYFNFKNIVDENLLHNLRGTETKANIPVLFTLSKNFKGESAIYIQKPKTIDQVIELANFFYEKENKPDTALGLVEQVLFSYPDNYTATKLKKEIEEKRFKPPYIRTNSNAYDLNYQKAVRLKNIDKNFEESLKYYFLAFQNNEKRESCIKDIGMLFIALGEPEKALEFIREHESELPENITTFNYLMNFYISAKKFNKVLEYADLLLEERLVINDKHKHSLYLSQKGFALIQLDKLEDASEVLGEAVAIHPENAQAKRLLKALDEPNNGELSQIIADAEFDTFGGGFSKYIKDTIDSYEEYFGVPAKVIDTGNFSNETLHAIRRLIETAGKARPRERANYLLTEAKLMTTLEPDKEYNLRTVLARYCNAMALNHISENSSMDVIRNFYIEAFSLEESYSLTAPQVALYLISYKSTYSDLLSLTTKTPSIDEALKFVLEGEIKENIWEGILSMFLWNRSISAQITSKLFEHYLMKEKSLMFLSSLGLNVIKSTSIEDYTNYWNQGREKRQRDYNRWLASIKAIYSNENLEILTNQLIDSLKEAKKSWLTQLDTSRLNIITTDIYDVLATYLRQSGYRDKERSYNFSKAQINQLISEIKEKPTKFSYEGLIPLLEKIDILLGKSFKTVEAASTPKVKASILGEASVVGTDNVVPFQITIENSKDSSPIRDIKVSVINNEDIIFLSKNNIYYDSIDGGEHCILKLSVQISERIIKDKAATLDVICEYKTRNQEDPINIQEQLSLRLYSEEEFEPIENPYAPIADGGPVTDSKMFYGRDEFIKNRITAILNSNSKQIIIYGQKRSGKSSVLHHLKQGLEATNKTFCISFSLGEIIRDLNEYTFYYKIINTISKSLRLKKAKGEIVPNFLCPTEAEFKDKNSTNPANGFIDLIEELKISCTELENWRNKKLVVMIDEFTYLYTAIRNGTTSNTIMKQWKAITENERANFSVVLVGQDVVPIFKKEDYAKNAFGVIEDIRLTYLDEPDARRLIEEPILDKKGESRFIGRAVSTIIDYTSRNPYYIQIFCARLVDYMNAMKVIRVTEADIKEVAETFIEGSQALAPEKFDNLIRAGEEHDFKEFDDEPLIKILRQIAVGSKNIGICSRDNISLNEKGLEDKILNHLLDREVLERKQGNNFKIQVKLFQEWLLRH